MVIANNILLKSVFFLEKLMFKEDQINNSDNMITESVKCGRCNQWFKREILEDKKIEKDGKVEEYLCPDCDNEIQEEDSE